MENETSIRLQGKIAEQTREIAALIRIIREIEALNDELIERHDRHEWFRKVTTLLLAMPIWRWMPQRSRYSRIRRKLAAHNLFDSDAYLRRYPDVAAEGMDPLHHYIFHGIEEGRKR